MKYFIASIEIFLFMQEVTGQTSLKYLKFIALGDSYTIGESVKEEERWPEQLASALRIKGYTVEKPRIIATTGWRTDDLKKAIESADLKSEYTLVTLLIGVNNQYQGKSIAIYKPEFEDLLRMAVQLAGGNKDNVFVVSIPDYGFTPYGEPKQQIISIELDEYNSINKSLCDAYGIRYVNITDISRQGLKQPELVAEDRLHPSGEQYKLWTAEIVKLF